MLDVATLAINKQSADCVNDAATVAANQRASNYAESDDDRAPIVAEGQLSAEAVFNPGVYFEEWWEAIEAFRNRAPEERGAEVSLDGRELDFESVSSFDGQIAETLEAPGTLVVAEHAMFQGDINVTVAIIKGVFKGKITATESVMVENHAVVLGDIDSPELVIRPGAIIAGKCHLENQKCLWEIPTEKQAPSEHQAKLQNLVKDKQPQFWAAPRSVLARVWQRRIFR